MPTSPSASDRAVFDAFLARQRLDRGEYVMLFQQLAQPALWEGVDMLVTVSCACLRVSRTYASGRGHGHWLGEFAQDVEAGVFPVRKEAAASHTPKAACAAR